MHEANLKRRFPGIEVFSIEQLPGRLFSYVVYKVNAELNGFPFVFVVKQIPLTPINPFKEYPANTETEYRFLEKSCKQGKICTPEPISLFEDSFAMTYVEGEKFSDIAKREVAGLVEIMAECVAELHSLNTSDFSFLPVRDADYRIEQVKKFKAPDDQLQAEAFKKLERTKPRMHQYVVCNGDVQSGHFLMTETGPCMIDFDGVCIGDAAYEIAWSFKGKKDFFFGQKREGERFMEKYCSKFGELKNFDFYWLLTVARVYTMGSTVAELVPENSHLLIIREGIDATRQELENLVGK
jgi:aminoglycoside phosphotransferase